MKWRKLIANKQRKKTQTNNQNEINKTTIKHHNLAYIVCTNIVKKSFNIMLYRYEYIQYELLNIYL